jgi:electron transfer flavoprotein beta subunit
MGAQDSKEVLTKCLAMGVDEAIFLYDSKAFAGADTVATSKVLAKAISMINDYDLIVCGMKTIDGETGQVPFGLAERLHINYINNIENIKSIANNEVTVLKRIDKNLVVGKQLLPALVIYNSFTLTNNYVTLLGMKKAQKKSITVWDRLALDMNEGDCGIKGSKTQVVNLVPICSKKECVILENNAVEQALFIQNIILKHTQGA